MTIVLKLFVFSFCENYLLKEVISPHILNNTEPATTVKDIVKSLYSNILRIAHLKNTQLEPVKEEMFPPMKILSGTRLHDLEKALGVKINNPAFFEQALTHRSYLQVLNSANYYSNERLEFLGDAILGMIIADYLFYLHRNVLEGELTKMRSWLVNKKSLSLCAQRLRLHEYMLLSYSASQSLQRGNESILADAVEALIAAVYLDSGFEETKKFIIHTLLPIMMGESMMQDTNFKSILLEYVQAQGRSAPRYVVLEEMGPDHDKEFTVAVFVDNDNLGVGTGKSKKMAEQKAAQVALEQKLNSQPAA